MLGLFNKKKTQLSKTYFVGVMLSLQQKIAKFLLKSAQQWNEEALLTSFQIDPYECEILSLCILSLAIKDKDLVLRNTICFEYCHNRKFDKDSTKRFLEHLDMRCMRYYDAFNEFVKDHGTGGAFLGSVVANGLKGGESDKLELCSIKASAASSLFVNSLKLAFEFIGDLKRKYDLSEISSGFIG
jgi:hypothetical protein